MTGTQTLATIKAHDGSRAEIVWVEETGALIALHHGRPEALDEGELYFRTAKGARDWIRRSYKDPCWSLICPDATGYYGWALDGDGRRPPCPHCGRGVGYSEAVADHHKCPYCGGTIYWCVPLGTMSLSRGEMLPPDEGPHWDKP